MQRTNKILIVVTNHEDLGDTGKKTGYFLREVSYPYKAIIEAGYSVDFVSPKGGPAPMDPNSNDMDDEVNKAFADDVNIMDRLQNTLSPDEINPDDYDGIMYAGGHGAVWDFPDSEGLSKIAVSIYERGGVLGAICHGPEGLVNMKLSDGTYLISGKRFSAFTDEEERAIKLEDVVPFLLASKLEERGGIHTKAENFKPHSEIDGRLVTAQNPPSAKSMGEAMVKVLSEI
ncbi:MAG: type 1 glutamine amidotransferase domain-containing protein [Legionellales bacterium]|nr:type 1 glutamine amidotransferase domain-containing protein [Legionellales bacterium]